MAEPSAGRTLRHRLAVRIIVWAMRFARGGWGWCANRSAGEFTTADGLEVFVRFRNRRQPDGYERTEVLRMLQTVRLEEARQEWECPDPGPAKRGQLVYDGLAVDVFYVWEEPRVDDGPWQLAQKAKEIVSVTADGRRRVVKRASL